MKEVLFAPPGIIGYVAVFGGAANDQLTREYIETVDIGALCAQRKLAVVTGGYEGLMEAASRGAVMAGGTAIGVTCKQIGPTKGNKYLSKTIVTDTLYERLQVLIANSSVFIVQRGGIGTLSELFLALDVLRKTPARQRPTLVLFGSYWNRNQQQLRGLIPQNEHHLFKVAGGIGELEKLLPRPAVA